MSFTKTSIAIFTLVAFAGFQATTLAQGASNDDNGNPSILQAVQALQTAINTLQTSVNALIASTTQGNTRFTPAAVAVTGDNGICTATNITDVARTLHVQLIDGNTGTLVSENGANGQLIQPGRSTAAPSGTNRRMFCRFTVVDGSRTDIRADFAIYAGTGSDKMVLPAE